MDKTKAIFPQSAGGSQITKPIGAMPLFDVPTGLIRILDRDLQAAGILKRDDRGRTVDMHAMRGTSGSLLAAAGTSPIVLKELMRHKRIETTLKHYVDPRLLDAAGAVATLPAIGFANATATRTAGESASGALNGAPNAARDSKSQGIADQMETAARGAAIAKRSRNHRISPAFRQKKKSGRRDSNPRHPAWEASALPTELRPRFWRV